MSGSIYQRSDTGAYYIKFKDQNGRWLTEKLGKISRADAEKVLTIRKSEVFQGKYNLADNQVKTIIFEKWCNEYQSILSDRREKNRLKPLINYFSGRTLNKVTAWDLKLFKDKRSQEVSNAETNKELKLLKRLMRAAAEKGFKNQIADCKLPLFINADKGRIRVLSYEEEKAMLETALKLGKTEVYNFLIIGLNTGCRPAEIYNLKFDNINFDKNIITVYQPKVKESKTIPLNDTLRQLFLKITANRKGEYILTNNNKPFHNSFFCKLWRIVRTNAGLDKDVIPYTLRHTFATRLCEAGVPVRRLMNYTGHKTLAMVMRYTHLENAETDLKLLDAKPEIKDIQAAIQA
ncbi:tyrosine-type recombinase/integrase [Candidatus Dependentiae bacterium]|nr:tyrosine-type recombinase/integrase [Candidatus Dependentiae bacterium]